MAEYPFPDPDHYRTKPATEWLCGGPVQKVSARYAHGALQAAMAERLRPWARGRGRVATEWHVFIRPGGEYRRPLVPDLAYVSYERIPKADVEGAQYPRIAPNVVIEILSPGERNIHVAEKVRVYLEAGAEVIVLIDPEKRTFVAHDPDVMRTYTIGEVFTHQAMPGFKLDVSGFFRELDD